MNRLVVLLPLFLGSITFADQWEKPLERIAFGSCYRENRSADIWNAVEGSKPDLFVFLGDNIYGDTEEMEVMWSKYEKLSSVPAYQELKSSCPILATWDDHDYGKNDAGEEYPMKAESQKLLLKAFDVPEERRPWRGEGVYDAYRFGPEGKVVQVILLDTRYFRSPLVKQETVLHPRLGPYGETLDPEATILGEAQWAWFREQVKEPADLRIVASSIQVLARDHHWERWQNIPAERELFFATLKEGLSIPTVLLSGDRHSSEIMEMPLSDALHPGYPLYEVTASGLNQGGGGSRDEPNRYRIGPRFMKSNFGLLEIDWSGDAPKVSMQIRDIEGETVLQLDR
ncbi:MAG: alkaline phosphatase D family protein [Verrucomicrobiota bacterium]